MRMRWTRCLAAGSSLVAAALVAPGARAQQIDVNPPKPNVLLLVDNSGSMERMIDGSLPEDNAANTCDVSGCTVTAGSATSCSWAATSPVPNRWNTMINALNGTPSNGFHCIAMPRDQGANSDFVREYQINGIAPYDSGYSLPFHRAIGLDTTTLGAGVKVPCTYAPGDLPGAVTGAGVGPNKYGAGAGITADQFPGNAIVTRPYGQVTIDQTAGHTLSCAYGQLSDGMLAVYQDIARFGLMTFDNDQSAASGVSASSPFSVLTPAQGGAFTGMWSYFPNWGGGGAGVSATGNPLGCKDPTPQAFEVGARNPAAPPWEGRMIEFPPASDATGARQTQNQQIRSVLAASRPYGGTPIAGMFADAQTYLWTDSTGPSASVVNPPTFGDPYAQGGCRQQFIILLTDGTPNQDMRPACGNTDNPSAPCPYNQPETTVAGLLAGSGGHKPVQTFVVGFALSNGSGTGNIDCTTLDPTSTTCASASPNSPVAACCALQRIALAGQPPLGGVLPDGQIQQIQPHAFFANTATDLSSALSAIMAQIAEGQTTRAVPAYSPVAANVTYSASTLSNQNTFYASFLPGVPTPAGGTLASVGEPWTGNIQRSRYLCSTHAPDTLTTNLGDDFGKNLALGGTRHFITVQPSATPALDATATIRPYDTAPGDGLGSYTGTQYSDTAANLVGVITPATLNLLPCSYLSTLGTGTATLTQAQCAAMLLDFTFGQAFTAPGFPFVARTGATAQGEALALGGIYHATPVVVGPPGSLLHDDSYDLFRTSTQTTTAGQAPVSSPKARDTIVYAATSDGLLHAFWADVGLFGGGQVQNEEWAFLPPGVMPKLQGAYPGADKFLLDGTPIVKDVVWDRKQGSLGTTGTNPWRTTLVAGFGPSQLGYYALDVTNPVFATKAGNYTETGASDPGGPAFLWQLTKTPATNRQLFGAHGATPSITQVAITEGDGAVHEVGVAILPGGWDTASTTPFAAPGCERYNHNKGITSNWGPTTGYGPRADVRCWGASGKFADPVVGRSVTIVRLDTGEVIASFMRKVDAPATDTLLTAGRIIDTPLDSPMTGTPAVYPSQTGADATKFYIGDIDGTIWRFDISNADPTKWQGKLFYDLYNVQVDNQTSNNDWANGQPIQLPLVTSLDPQGRVVVIAASGNTDSFDQTGPNFVASLTETIQSPGGITDFHAGVNWYLASKLPGGTQLSPTPVMDVGERVSGPMVVFNSSVYFTTYSAGTASSVSCSQGDAHLYGFDYIRPSTSGVSYGGTITITPTAGFSYQDLGLTAAASGGAVVPGISVQQTTACATTTSGLDQYVAGATHTSTSTYTAGSFSLVALTGKSNQTNGVGTLNIPLNSPNSATLIDSWATVTE